MKEKLVVIIGLVICCYGMTFAAAEPYIDPDYKKVAEAITLETETCMQKQKSPVKKFECGDDLRKKYEQEGKIRGTETYCKVNYRDLSFNELDKLFKKLRARQKTARSSMDVMFDDQKPGEVTQEDLQTELIWIESRLAGIQKANIQKMEKDLQSRPGLKPEKE